MNKKLIIVLVFVAIFSISIFAQEGEDNNPYNTEEPENLTLEELFLGLQNIPLESVKTVIEAGNNHDLLLTMIQVLKNKGDDESVDLLMDVLDIGIKNVSTQNGKILNDFWDVRVEACIALGELKAKKAVKKLQETLISDPDPIVKTYAAIALGKIGDKSAVPTLINMLNYYKSEYRSQTAPLFYGIIVALGDLGDPQAFAILLEISQGPYPQFIKQTAITSIKKIQSKS